MTRALRSLSALAALAMGAPAAGCAAKAGRVKAAELATMLDRDDVVFVDVRSRAEFRAPAGHVPGAIHAPWPDIKETAAALPVSADQTVVLLCFTGHRSQWAKPHVAEATGATVLDLQGGMLAWWAKELPVTVEEADDPSAKRDPADAGDGRRTDGVREE